MYNKSTHVLANILPLIEMEEKPRTRGMNYVRCPKSLGGLKDIIESYAECIDIIKFAGHQATCIPEAKLKEAIDLCHEHQILTSIGNPVLDAALIGGAETAKRVVDYLASIGVDIMEVSCIGRSIDEKDLAELISYMIEASIKPLVEIGVAFAHMSVNHNELFLNRRKALARKALDAGAWKIVLESEQLSEEVPLDEVKWDFIDSFLDAMDLDNVIVEADDQDIMSRYVDVYGPKINMMVDVVRLAQMESVRFGFGPNASTWGKVTSFRK